MKNIYYGLTSLLLLCLFSAHALGAEPKENINYIVTDHNTKTSEMEVIEFFRYDCHNCFYTENFIENWLTTKPNNIKFTRIPVALSERSQLYAKAYHIGDILDILDASHSSIYKRIHNHKQHLKNDEQLKQYFLSIGVTAKQYDSIDKSFQLAARMRQSRNAVKDHSFTRLPTFLINGKYITEYGIHKWPSRIKPSKGPSGKTTSIEPIPGPTRNFEILERMLSTPYSCINFSYEVNLDPQIKCSKALFLRVSRTHQRLS